MGVGLMFGLPQFALLVIQELAASYQKVADVAGYVIPCSLHSANTACIIWFITDYPFHCQMWPKANFQISFSKILTNKQHLVKVQAESFHLNGHIIGFRPHTQKLESPNKTLSNTLAVKGLKKRGLKVGSVRVFDIVL